MGVLDRAHVCVILTAPTKPDKSHSVEAMNYECILLFIAVHVYVCIFYPHGAYHS